MTSAWVKPDRGIHIALATTLDEDIPTHMIIRAVHEDGSALSWAMSASEARQFAAAILDHADVIDPPH